ncbi:girdin-like isoform X1 [Archocentrus centrarchus]|uniref:girdin-like isoform X1 n=1 Tax=Archocentrus centrarchus TaxID=63155 RepID=UPI0011EA40E9|nr:girdin-like isoform X1 [Archocentrus centrarchus]XP_030609435.1 girdin-like isoform X1 [Archocentrus centrarchus]
MSFRLAVAPGLFVTLVVVIYKWRQRKTVEPLEKTQAELQSKTEEICELKEELEKLEWLRNDTLKGMNESQRKLTKLTLAIKRMEKLEENTDLDRFNAEINRRKENEEHLQIMKLRLEDENKELNEELAKVKHQLRNEGQRRRDAEITMQTLKKKLGISNEKLKEIETEVLKLRAEKNRREGDTEELQTLQKKLQAKNEELKEKIAEVLKLRAEKNRREADVNELQAKNEEVKAAAEEAVKESETSAEKCE